MQVEELINILQKKDHFILAIDGMCASGKSTLAKELKERLSAHVFHMDDFYLPLSMRTTERLQEPGGNVDYERFLETVLQPLSKQQDIDYQPFDCACMQLSPDIQHITYCPYNIIEGSYALRPELLSYYTNVVVLKITPELQRERLKNRNPEQFEQFIKQWIPLENHYFEYYHIFDKYSLMNI